MADQEHNSVLTNQAEGHTGGATPKDAEQKIQPTPTTAQTQGGFTGDVSGQSTAQQAQNQGQGFAGQTQMSGEPNQQVHQGQQSSAQHVPGGDPIGQNNQSYGQSAEQDTTGGQGAQEAHLASTGSSGVLGEGPGQTLGQPGSPTTGGPDLSKGLVDHNKGGGI